MHTYTHKYTYIYIYTKSCVKESKLVDLLLVLLNENNYSINN